MKLGIITHPLAANYGGLLQNYALQQALKRLGHDVYTINRNSIPNVYTAKLAERIKFNLKNVAKRSIGRSVPPSLDQLILSRELCRKFTEENITTTEVFHNQQELASLIEKNSFEGYVVGSDQVWRPSYSINIYNDFLDFCQKLKGVKRMAYAASFGVADWEFSKEQTDKCSSLAKLFDAISVREESGIRLCKEHLGVEAIQVLDPTLLLGKEDYIRLAECNGEQESDGELFCYILDGTTEVDNIINIISQKLSLRSFQIKAKKSASEYKEHSNKEDYQIPSPTKWIRAFMDAKMVFTDSFHGCAFSIIFNKPFWVIGNKRRGNARFDSLLKLFKLEDRRISLDEVVNTDMRRPINWNSVNEIKKEWQKKSYDFIKENL